MTTPIQRPIFIRGLRSWLNYNGLHPLDVFWAFVCLAALILSLAWPRPQLAPVKGPCRAVIYETHASATAYFGSYNTAGECVVLRKENRG